MINIICKYINKIKKDKFLIIFIILYIAVNILFLTKFPFVHSDESWTSGLSRNIMESKSFSVTESFFDLYPRYPHAIKIIFQGLQIIFIKIIGYKVFSVRLISLLFSGVTLYFYYKICKYIFEDKEKANITVVLLSFDIQYIYASHFARQEIVILFFLVVGLYYFFSRRLSIEFRGEYTGASGGASGDRAGIKGDIVLGIIIGLSIGIHPNSFIIALTIALIYLYSIIFASKNLSFKNFISYGITVGIFALIFIGISISFNRDFFIDYFNYGKEFGVDYPIMTKLSTIKYFYYKLYEGISGTYYTPNIKLQFWIFGAAFVGTVLKLMKSIHKKNSIKAEKIIPIILAIIGINLGIILIGRFNQTSVVFQFPFFYLLIVYFINDAKLMYRRLIFTVLAVILLFNSVTSIIPYMDSSYDRYLNEISKAVKKDQVVLANLNCDYYFENGKLYDYRNLDFLKKNNMEFKDYIAKNKIEYIIYPEEMEVIYKEKPRWDGLYGSLSYYEDMNKFLKENCELVYQFEDKIYGMRIVRYINDRPWKIKIYKVKRTL
ncbi:dolichyl-phosphate-mannose-protein mannosyltransferase [Clostridium homopropionicum DSM 5847]|uniref:Dolichyl-phosphate-mannose-protein mannosyltransferase n=1 Tax=Clostridium homopropionicum DSM 5847 TaxID=1121318 RepID=A0A0L6Z7N0_9CLOT|nr:glycosyltransferase family 39 protein [Clostridium homopropionicum]KOA18975.1 dolichyl-phosphate-mannose-protein mannosyltransferase [Clostridium homopropionicum DSM 5847]SFG42938.1 Dolichyl-phosphate-mannose-protein mannosyltransferase [Clostridium homopropionicum]